jgi:hypothetical protein
MSLPRRMNVSDIGAGRELDLQEGTRCATQEAYSLVRRRKKIDVSEEQT